MKSKKKQMEFQKYCRERRELLKAERHKMEPLLFKRIQFGFCQQSISLQI